MFFVFLLVVVVILSTGLALTEERKKEYEFTVFVNTKYSSTEKKRKRAR